MRSSALVAASLAGSALAGPHFKRTYETDVDIVTITKFITATGPCPSTTFAPETSVVTAPAGSGWFSSLFAPLPTTSSVVVVTSVTQASSEVPVVESTSAVVPVATTYTVSASSTPAVVPETTPAVVASSSAVVATSSAVVATSSAAVTTSAAPSTTEAPSSTSAGGISTYARCATSSVDSTASLTAEPTSVAAKRWLAFHNAHRANHTDGCSLYWDYDLENKAKESANLCVYEHTITDTTNFGQNMGEMSIGTGGSISEDNLDQSPEFFTSMYYEEYNDFGPYWGAETVPTDGPNILHLTQMLWQKSYAVGCATSSCPSSNMMLTYCNYRSRGNILNEYGDNVGLFIDSPLPPICSEIGSTATDGSCITDAQLGL